jgi:hypothetical protein
MNRIRRNWILLCCWFRGWFGPSFKRKLRKIEKENNLKDWPRVRSKDDGELFFLGKLQYKVLELNNRKITKHIVPTDYMVFFKKRWRRVYSNTKSKPRWFVVWNKDKISITKENFKDFKE